MKTKKLAVVAIFAAILVAVTGIQAADYVPGDVIVKLEHGILDITSTDEIPLEQVTINNQELAGALQNYGTHSVEKLFKSILAQPNPTIVTRSGREVQLIDLSQVYIFRMAEYLDMELVAEQLEQLPGVIYAHPNHIGEYCYIPIDADFGSQWGLHSGYGNEWDINAPEAWNIQTGNSDVKLAVLDKGLEKDHYDQSTDEFYGRVTGKWAYDILFPGNATAEDIDDPHGHGTAVTGIAAATTGNETGQGGVHGIAGVAGGLYGTGGVSIFAAKTPVALEYVCTAIEWAIAQDVDVLNGSWGWHWSVYLEALHETIEDAFRSEMTLFFSTGNFDEDKLKFPANLAEYDICCAVGAMDQQGERAVWDINGYHFGSNYGSEISFVAPGSGIHSTWNEPEYYTFGMPPKTISGTSYATPMATGTGALLYSQAEDRGYELLDVDCKRIMQHSARDITEGEASDGWDKYTGYGCVDAEKAVKHLAPPYVLVHDEVPNQDLWGYAGVPSVWVRFTRPPRPELDTGTYVCYKYTLWKTITPPASPETPWVWGRILDGAAGYSGAVLPDSNDAWFHVDDTILPSGDAQLTTYLYELLWYEDQIQQAMFEVPEQYRWAPRDYFEVTIAYTMIYHSGAPLGYEAIEEDNLAFSVETPAIIKSHGLVKLTLDVETDVDLFLYNSIGQKVETLHSGTLDAGTHSIAISTGDLPAGAYFIKATVGAHNQINKIVILD